MEEFCLKWRGFHANYREYFKRLRDNQRFFDVTLATDDGRHIQAHKIILSAGSDFFDDIFMKSNHGNNMLVYLKGISSLHLEHVTDFIYRGETFVAEEQMQHFLKTARELHVKGLMDEVQWEEENDMAEQNNIQQNQFRKNLDNEKDACEVRTISEMENRNESKGESFNQENFHSKEDTPVPVEHDGTIIDLVDASNDELDYKIEEIIEKIEGVWKCKMCGKTKTHKSHMKDHAETHIEGISHACHICSRLFSCRKTLQAHKGNSDLQAGIWFGSVALSPIITFRHSCMMHDA